MAAVTRIAKNELTTSVQLSRFELGVCMLVYKWEALTVAVQNQWGGPDSADKRDWASGAVVALYEEQDEVDEEDIETRLLQIMEDEFDVNVEDDTAYDTAQKIVKVFEQCKKNDFSTVDELYKEYEASGQRSRTSASVQVVEQQEFSGDELDM
ncbi:Pre-rRNA-processing protein TSR2-domain-containing protein [Lipomyces japonicus]|uniref:Pre-rRNA-processing protein TSR2-domain-containing protein n=1 Tax=Lipomyces japonicus TaxID=56871 RepID=UPI0034CDDA21